MVWLCTTLFTWLVHDRRMPGWPSVFDRVPAGPILKVGDHGTFVSVIIDIGLFAIFGLLHAGFARRAAYRALRTAGGVHKQALRTVYMTVTAAGWLTLMFCWQHTGVVVWDLRPALGRIGISAAAVDKYGPLIPFAFALLCVGTVLRHGALRFLGIRQLLSSPERTNDLGGYLEGETTEAPKLLTTGIYGVVRHPMYMYLLATALVHLVLSLDLLIWALSAMTLLAAALPYEEEKLIVTFGEAYRDYQKRTPAFVPFLPMRNN
jgi:protein-S-isoprenylcysteine O-methyltransferase Ste14